MQVTIIPSINHEQYVDYCSPFAQGIFFLFIYRTELNLRLLQQNTVLWDATPSNPVDVRRRFGESFCVHFTGFSVSNTGCQ
jgi:hypothetical protein